MGSAVSIGIAISVAVSMTVGEAIGSTVGVLTVSSGGAIGGGGDGSGSSSSSSSVVLAGWESRGLLRLDMLQSILMGVNALEQFILDSFLPLDSWRSSSSLRLGMSTRKRILDNLWHMRSKAAVASLLWNFSDESRLDLLLSLDSLCG